MSVYDANENARAWERIKSLQGFRPVTMPSSGYRPPAKVAHPTLPSVEQEQAEVAAAARGYAPAPGPTPATEPVPGLIPPAPKEDAPKVPEAGAMISEGTKGKTGPKMAGPEAMKPAYGLDGKRDEQDWDY